MFNFIAVFVSFGIGSFFLAPAATAGCCIEIRVPETRVHGLDPIHIDPPPPIRLPTDREIVNSTKHNVVEAANVATFGELGRQRDEANKQHQLEESRLRLQAQETSEMDKKLDARQVAELAKIELRGKLHQIEVLSELKQSGLQLVRSFGEIVNEGAENQLILQRIYQVNQRNSELISDVNNDLMALQSMSVIARSSQQNSANLVSSQQQIYAQFVEHARQNSLQLKEYLLVLIDHQEGLKDQRSNLAHRISEMAGTCANAFLPIDQEIAYLKQEALQDLNLYNAQMLQINSQFKPFKTPNELNQYDLEAKQVVQRASPSVR